MNSEERVLLRYQKQSVRTAVVLTGFFFFLRNQFYFEVKLHAQKTQVLWSFKQRKMQERKETAPIEIDMEYKGLLVSFLTVNGYEIG